MKPSLVMMKVFLCLLVSFGACSAASNINPTGTAVTRRPELIVTTNSADIPVPTSTKPVKKPTKTVEAPSTEEDAEEPIEPTETTEDSPHPTANPKSPDSEPATPTNPSSPVSPTDPTDYSTVWPTRWRPRRRFGAQSEASPRFLPNWKLIVFILISVILL